MKVVLFIYFNARSCTYGDVLWRYRIVIILQSSVFQQVPRDQLDVLMNCHETLLERCLQLMTHQIQLN